MTLTFDFDTASENMEDNFMCPEQRANDEASFCGLGCPTEADCTHAPEDEDEQDAEDQREADFDPDFGWMDDFDGREADRAADLWERNFWGD